MVWSAKTSTLFLLAGSALVSSAALPSHSIAAIGTSIVSRRDGSYLPITFEAACSGCFDGEDAEVVFNLDLLSTSSVCGESRVRLNGRELNLTWDGTTAAGETNLTGKLSQGKGDTTLSMNYRAVCVASPEDSVEAYAAQILAVTFYPAGRVGEDNETSGFALSFNSVGNPEVFRLLTSPVSISEEDNSFESWLDSSDSDQFHVQDNNTDKPSRIDDLEEELQQLHILKQEAQKLDDLIKEKDQQIRMHLVHDCLCLKSRLKNCETLKCFVETSIKFVPDIFRLMKYRFGTLPSTLSGTPCRPVDGGRGYQNSTSPIKSPTGSSNDSQVTVETKPDSTTPRLPQAPVISPLKPRPMGNVIGDMAAVLLLVVIVALTFKRCGNSLSCRRRRVDFAARREERRTRHAYRAAACRYRFRLWWTGLWNSLHGIPNPQPPQSRARFNLPEADSNVFRDPRQPPQPGENTMRNEILGFRRALEYVGQLVHINGSQDPALHNHQASGDLAEIGIIRGSAGTPTVISSVAPLTTVGSPRTSTVLSYDETDDSGTIESIDLETATMLSA
ncbi:hypothetical protein D8B26_000235 [Coccidioides posadasii str. Silveira]|uniref:Uncharacterized protein n=2 Tax=Coccidioides posadasii TaxID=199306 RepID=E9D825_COCPS|nr:hypothetical protein CPC735_065690 [Coccidioides posadasii C735 delta SOWgp]EER25469.1 hypothetical protein CPC735_065690 [Coccidioides posadasii C735 delta SOWgp]EFW17534.1 conserved hypothetical protein [Coccidioides posadasii str. Silveira]QVM05527.1 hypothetical protein D8B26_000235 [Coccidioides posadasii str. Silveira]|eukprot:XP_003067614.1 hypothetical protein CPC735_065690 [Coccidioides posadasii C735 delta SOWgp]